MAKKNKYASVVFPQGSKPAKKMKVDWWEGILVFLLCAFIFVVVIMCVYGLAWGMFTFKERVGQYDHHICMVTSTDKSVCGVN